MVGLETKKNILTNYFMEPDKSKKSGSTKDGMGILLAKSEILWKSLIHSQ